MEKRILVATDGGPGALAALRHAGEMAEREGCEVRILSVVEPIYFEQPGWGLQAVTETNAPLDALDRRAEEIRSQLTLLDGPARDFPVSILVGPIAGAIVGFAVRNEVSMILIGRRSPSLARRLLGGGTTQRVIRTSPVPVLVVGESGVVVERRHGRVEDGIVMGVRGYTA